MDIKEIKKLVEDIRIKKDLIISKQDFLLDSSYLYREVIDEEREEIERLKSEVDYMELLLQDILD